MITPSAAHTQRGMMVDFTMLGTIFPYVVIVLVVGIPSVVLLVRRDRYRDRRLARNLKRRIELADLDHFAIEQQVEVPPMLRQLYEMQELHGLVSWFVPDKLEAEDDMPLPGQFFPGQFVRCLLPPDQQTATIYGDVVRQGFIPFALLEGGSVLAVSCASAVESRQLTICSPKFLPHRFACRTIPDTLDAFVCRVEEALVAQLL